jgi:hypothetical protein
VTVIDFNEFKKKSIFKSKILKHKEVLLIASLVGFLLFSLAGIEIQNSNKTFDEDAVLNYMMIISDRYNTSYFMHENMHIDDAQYLSDLLAVQIEYEKYLSAVENHDWAVSSSMITLDSLEFELGKINQEILYLETL